MAVHSSSPGRSIVLGGERVALAVMTEEDQPMFQRWLADSAQLRQLIDDPHVPTTEDQLRWFQRIREPDRTFFSIVTVPEQELIGNGGFVDIDHRRGEAILRITIGNTAFLGRGLGTEAVSLLVRYGFEIAGWRKLTLKVLASNPRAIRTYEKIGFVRERTDLRSGTTIITMALTPPPP